MCTASDNSGQDPFKALKLIPKPKTRDVVTTSLKAAVSIILILSVSIALYSVIHGAARPDFFLWPDSADPALYMTRFKSDDSPTNISHIAFGLGGSTGTWAKRAAYSDLWWKPGFTRGFVFLEKEPDEKTRFGIGHRVSSDWRRFRRTVGSESAVRIARVAVDLFRVGLPNVRWFVMGDDDTVFFPENMAAVLGKYDHRRMVYVGGNSESVEQDVMHAYDMAFGGGGFAISYPLAAELAAAMDGCLNRYHNFYGSDQRVWACVGELGVGLTREPGFHQIDIRGDPFGLLAAHPLVPLVSLHHLDSINPLFPNQTQLESFGALMKAYEADPSRILQQCFCYHHKYKWSVSVSWGYTVQIFPVLLTAKELETPQLTFKTWRTWSDGPFTFNTRPVSSDPCQRPIVFYLSSVVEGETNKTVTTYKRSVAQPVSNCNKDYAHAVAIENIVVSASRMEPQELNQSPRRQCCDIDGNLGNGTMRIRIRRCKHSETITI
ncbi:glycosyltransferase [Perilla frutescens var. hirtella]|uniref:Glycosyltransferase n=1 Tax=Perilla frutescens var. hirtella TaxID=608512 RepID=A0AAD4JJX5_PERFH|nr:glycosyltransferase [Perilla frutescens var. hirtella]